MMMAHGTNSIYDLFRTTMMKSCLWTALVLVKLFTLSLAGPALVNKLSAEESDRVLNVHVVSHTHDDVGWRKTVEQYYYGWNNTIDTRGNVKSIITTAIESLLENPARTFTYVEQKFFSMWWNEQTDVVKDSVRFLLANQQLFFVNGGWCMHDEASTHYMGMIDQTTLGHQFLLEELGVRPTVGWQLDPFGHSATQASLLSARVGFDALYFGRIDYQDLELRRRTRECEGLWNASNSLNDTTIFWGLTGSYGGNYGPPPGFCFDILCEDEPLIGANSTRLMERIHTFLEYLRIQSDETQGNHIMLTMGSDFNYMEAHTNFANLDLLIGSIMNYQRWDVVDIPAMFGPRYDRINIFYSTPEYYTKMKHKETREAKETAPAKPNWSVKRDDFFPYSDCPHCFWTGYFTSRTAFKRFERVCSSFLLAARQIGALVNVNTSRVTDPAPLYALEDALGIAQHHDAVSGTGKQHVADDYSKKLQIGMDSVLPFVTEKLKAAFLNASDSSLDNLSFCLLLNETKCEVSEQATTEAGTDLYTIVYNPIALARSTIVRLPVSSETLYRIERLDGKGGDAKVIQAIRESGLHDCCAKKYVLMFDTGSLPPVGAVAFRVSITNATDSLQTSGVLTSAERRLQSKGHVQFTNDFLTVTFDEQTGMMTQISTKEVAVNVTQTWGYYTSFDSAFDRSDGQISSGATQNSGAYIFRPSVPEQKLIPVEPSGKATFVNTSVGIEIHVPFVEPWIKQVTRIFEGQPYVEIEYTIGPIPTDDGRGKEVVTRLLTPIQSEGVFYTDSNGREFLKRKRNSRPSWNLDVYEPVAGNYYPVNAAMYLEDSNASLAVVVDRSQGGGSILDGSLELMVQRRTLADDARGVDEPLNETRGGMTPYPPYGKAVRLGKGVVIRGTHRIMVGKGGTGASLARSEMDRAFAEPLVFVGSSPSDSPVSFRQFSFSGLQKSLPPNVMLVTLAELSGQNEPTFLLRLGHQYAMGEDKILSSSIQLNLASVLKEFNVTSIKEKTLSGNQDWDDWLHRRLDWTGKGEPLNKKRTRDPSDFTITLNPMEIRTFELLVSAE